MLTYVMIGKIFGQQIEQWLHIISQYSVIAISVVAIGLVTVFLVKHNKMAIMNWIRTKSVK